jgi:hypothetical protein
MDLRKASSMRGGDWNGSGGSSGREQFHARKSAAWRAKQNRNSSRNLMEEERPDFLVGQMSHPEPPLGETSVTSPSSSVKRLARDPDARRLPTNVLSSTGLRSNGVLTMVCETCGSETVSNLVSPTKDRRRHRRASMSKASSARNMHSPQKQAIPDVTSPSDESSRRRLTRDPLNKSMRARGVIASRGISERQMRVDMEEDDWPLRSRGSTWDSTRNGPLLKDPKTSSSSSSPRQVAGPHSPSPRSTHKAVLDRDRIRAGRLVSEADNLTGLDLTKSAELTSSPPQSQRQKISVPSKEELLRAVAANLPDDASERPTMGRKLMGGLLRLSSVAQLKA